MNDLSLPLDFKNKSAIQSWEISTIKEGHKEEDKLITKEPNKEVTINKDRFNTHSFNFICCLIIEFVTKLE